MKKAQSSGINLVIILAIGAILLVGAIMFLYQYESISKGTSAKSAIQFWVKQRALAKAQIGSDVPPVRELASPYVIDNVNNLKANGNTPPKAFEEIANSMYDCWDAFDRGQSDFVNGDQNSNIPIFGRLHKSTFCYPCRTIKFSDKVKNEFPTISGFNRYLNEYQPVPSPNKPTYLQFLANDYSNEYKLDEEDLKIDTIKTDKDLYILLFAASGRTWSNIILSSLDLEGFVEEDIKKGYAAISTGTEGSNLQGSGEDISGARAFELGTTSGGGYLTAKSYLFYQQYVSGIYAGEQTTAQLAKLLSQEAQLSTVAIPGGAAESLGTSKEILTKIANTEKQIVNLNKAASAAEGAKQIELAEQVLTAEKQLSKLRYLETTAKAIESGSLALKTEIIVGETGAKTLAITLTEKEGAKLGEKALAKTLARRLVSKGFLTALGSKLNLYATVALITYGSYKVIVGDKPFIATVVLADPKSIIDKCNDEQSTQSTTAQQVSTRRETIGHNF